MEPTQVDWNEQEFRAYLMLYAANSNFIETVEERELILSKIDFLTYKKMHRELDRDNDYQQIQKILYCMNKFCYSEEELKQLENEIKDVLNVDGYHDELETNMFLGLKKLMH